MENEIKIINKKYFSMFYTKGVNDKGDIKIMFFKELIKCLKETNLVRKINIEIAKEIIADHYDVYLLKEDNPCSRTVCSHYDLDAREYMSQEGRPKPFAPHGAVDGFVMDSTLAKKMAFVGRFGNSCGIPFNKNLPVGSILILSILFVNT